MKKLLIAILLVMMLVGCQDPEIVQETPIEDEIIEEYLFVEQTVSESRLTLKWRATSIMSNQMTNITVEGNFSVWYGQQFLSILNNGEWITVYRFNYVNENGYDRVGLGIKKADVKNDIWGVE
jgi:uncharacterized protein YcfL